VQPGIALRVGIGPELAEELDFERGLFAGLADGRRLERLPVVHEAARKGPAGRRVAAFDEDDPQRSPAVHDLDDDVDRRDGIAVLRAAHGFARGNSFILGALFSPCQQERGRFLGRGVLDGGQSLRRAGRRLGKGDWHEKC